MKRFFLSTVLIAAALAAIARAPRASTFRLASSALRSADIPSTSIVVGLRQSSGSSSQPDPPVEPPAPPPARAGAELPAPPIAGDPSRPLQPEMKIQIIRYIDGEFAKAAKALPGKPKGFTITVGRSFDQQAYQDALRLQGTAIGAGDPVQVTRLDFEAHRIVIQLNGGAKKKFHLKDHLEIGLGGGPAPVTSADGTNGKGEGLGAVIVLDYQKPLPDVSPDDIKKELSQLLDFSKQPSAAVNWIDTLPPRFQQAVKDHKALAGMDQQTVLAALGHPDRKVRERNEDGVETEDWIYGNPPARTVFVTFIGDKVVKVEEFD